MRSNMKGFKISRFGFNSFYGAGVAGAMAVVLNDLAICKAKPPTANHASHRRLRKQRRASGQGLGVEGYPLAVRAVAQLLHRDVGAL